MVGGCSGWGWSGLGGGVRVDEIEELRFWGKFTQKNSGGVGRGDSGGGRVGGGQVGCERNVGGRG